MGAFRQTRKRVADSDNNREVRKGLTSPLCNIRSSCEGLVSSTEPGGIEAQESRDLESPQPRVIAIGRSE